MGWQGDWIPVLSRSGRAAFDRATASLRELGWVSREERGWTHPNAADLGVHHGREAPTEDESAASEIAGWFLVRRVHDENDEALAQRTAEALAHALESFVVQADGMGFVLHDGREAKSVRDALLRLVEVDAEEDAPISIDWSELPGPSAAALVIVFRGDRPFTAHEFAAAVRTIAPEADLAPGGAGAKWKELRGTDPYLAWTLLLERGHRSTKVPFYVRAHFDYGERDLGGLTGDEVLVSRDDLRGAVELARAFTERIAPELALTPIDIEAR